MTRYSLHIDVIEEGGLSTIMDRRDLSFAQLANLLRRAMEDVGPTESGADPAFDITIVKRDA